MKTTWSMRNNPNKTNNGKITASIKYQKDMKKIKVNIENNNVASIVNTFLKHDKAQRLRKHFRDTG